MMTVAMNGRNSPHLVKENTSSPKISKHIEDREKIVQEALKDSCIPLACECLSNHFNKVYDDSPEQLLRCLDRVQSLYNQIFSASLYLNDSGVRKPVFLKDEDKIEQAFIKADKLYRACFDSDLSEVVSLTPKFLLEKLSLKREDSVYVEKIFHQALQKIKDPYLESALAMFETSSKSIIHYFLGIPPNVKNSTGTRSLTSWVLRDLVKNNLIELDKAD